MNARDLQQEVVVSGRDILGRRRSTRFVPYLPGWWIEFPGELPVRIGFELIKEYKPYTVSLFYKGHWLHIVEHILPVAYTGLGYGKTGVCIVTEGDEWPAYSGSIADFFLPLFNESRGVEEEVKTVHLPPGSHITECTEQGKLLRTTNIANNTGDVGRISVAVNYLAHGFGAYQCAYETGEPFTQAMIHSRPYGQHWWLYHPARTMSALGWPHFNKILWPQEVKRFARPEDMAREIANHRLVDFLGMSAAFCGSHLFVANVDTKCGNHRGDHAAFQKIKSSNLIYSL